MKNVKQLNEEYDKILKTGIKEDEELVEGDLIITQQLSGITNKFFGIIKGFDEFKDDEESFNNYKSDKIVLIKPLCTLNGDIVSDFHTFDANGFIRLGNKNYRMQKVDKVRFEKAMANATERVKNFETALKEI